MSGTSLTQFVRTADLWATPTARDHRSGYASAETLSKNARPLSEQTVSLWPTATVSTGGYTRDRGEKGRERLTLEGLSKTLPSSLPDPETPPLGAASAPAGLTLNPQFVEWLMGWPIGWTVCACSETAFALWQRRMRSELSRLASPPAPPAQLALFA